MAALMACALAVAEGQADFTGGMDPNNIQNRVSDETVDDEDHTDEAPHIKWTGRFLHM